MEYKIIECISCLSSAIIFSSFYVNFMKLKYSKFKSILFLIAIASFFNIIFNFSLEYINLSVYQISFLVNITTIIPAIIFSHYMSEDNFKKGIFTFLLYLCINFASNIICFFIVQKLVNNIQSQQIINSEYIVLSNTFTFIIVFIAIIAYLAKQNKEKNRVFILLLFLPITQMAVVAIMVLSFMNKFKLNDLNSILQFFIVVMIIDIITIEYINRRINLWQLEKRFYELEMENQKNYYYKNLLKNQKIYFNEMAHEFKSPLTNIIGYGQIIKNNEFTDIEFFNRGIDSIISETKRLDKMSTSLLDVYKDEFENLNKSNYIDVNLSKLVTDISQNLFLNKASKKNIKIKLDVEENIEFNCDELELMSIVNNLVDNSIKYSKERTVIKVSLKEDSENIYLTVKDKGIGMSKHDQDNIFLPFYQIKIKQEHEKGSIGMGLSIVQANVKKYGGDIIVDSKLNVGTMITIKLPINTEKVQESTEIQEAESL